jgi:hypothetical protein
MGNNWLIDFICDAKANEWCNKLWCTTCGAFEFRSEFARLAVLHVDPLRRPPLLQNLPPDIMDQVTDAAALVLTKICFSELNARCGQQYAEYSIGMILYEIGVRPGQPMIMQSLSVLRILEGSEVGAYAREWELAAHEQSKKEEERREFQSPGAATKRREMRRKARAATARTRNEEKQLRESRRADFLQRFAALTPQEKLLCLANGADGWSADVIPQQDVKNLSIECIALTPEQKESLIHFIGNRRGVWRVFKEYLTHPMRQ